MSTDEPSTSDARLQAVLDAALDAIVTTDAHGTVLSFNPAAERLFGWARAEVVGRNVSVLMPGDEAIRHAGYMRAHEQGGAPKVLGRTRALRGRHKDGADFPIEISLSSASVEGQVLITGIIRDITERRADEAELSQYRERLEEMVRARTAELELARAELQHANTRLAAQVRIDALTGVGNRLALDERIGLEWRRCSRDGSPLSLVICDVDHFEAFNDALGHPAGDRCLQQVADCLRQTFQRAGDFVARHGGEAFAVVLPGTPLDGARSLAHELLGRVRALDILHPKTERGLLTLSAGVACVSPALGLDGDTLLRRADAALHRAKDGGRDRVEVARPGEAD